MGAGLSVRRGGRGHERPRDDDERESDQAEHDLCDMGALAEYHDQEAATRAFAREQGRAW